MIEQQRKRVERAISDMVNDMYMTHLRRMQSQMHLCAAKCCDDTRGTLETTQSCIEMCALPLNRAQEYMQHELTQFQGSLQRCVMQCSDDARRKLSDHPRETELRQYQNQFEGCTVRCVDKHIGLIPNMMKTIKVVLAKGPDAMRPA